MSVPVNAIAIGQSQCRTRNRSHDGFVFNACSAIKASQRWFSNDSIIVERTPSDVWIAIQRFAVIRLPDRDRGGADVTIQIRGDFRLRTIPFIIYRYGLSLWESNCELFQFRD
jgi:hypothetical protein